MALRVRFALAVALAASFLFGLTLVAQSGETYKARLTAVPADAKTRPDLAGIGTATAVLAGSKLTVTESSEGLKTAATVANLPNDAAVQANLGRAAYKQNCASCRGEDLSVQGNAAPLAGGLFMGGWGDKSPADVISFLEGAMPPGNPGGLGEQNYINITAYLLEQNGARAGNQALTAASRVTISTVATRQRPAADD